MTRAKLLFAVCLLLGLATAAQAQLCDGDQDCDDGNFCNGMETCVLLTCQPGDPQDGESCDDGLFCTVGDSCSGGACGGGGTRDCSGQDGACVSGICNEAADACEPEPANEGGDCDDGEFCTVNDVCSNGMCDGSARDCAFLGGTCTVGVCDEDDNACEARAANEGADCDDGQFCTVNDSCDNGMCDGSTRDCSQLDGACTNGVCDEALDACQAQPANEGDGCSDGAFCTVNDVCGNGMCVGTPRNCSAQNGVCTTGVCNETSDACQAQPANQGGTCDDGLFCSVGDRCNNGMCSGTGPRDCSAQTTACTTGVCNEGSNACQAQVANEGGNCGDDGNQCTRDVCASGTCQHSNRAANAGCDDGLFCTATDTCNGMGTCVGAGDPCAAGAECAASCNESANNCFAAGTVACTDDGNICTDDLCNGTGACAHPPNTAPCEDGLFCNGADVCSGGACTHAGDPCAGGAECLNTCNETVDDCVTPAGAPCKDDGLECTTDLCAAGACAHAAVDSLCDQGDCVLGVCMPTNPDADKRGCVARAVSEGEQCTDDGFGCTDDVCTAGACLHVPIASRCVPPDDCTSAVCEPGQPTADAAGCIPGPALEEGQECAEDGQPCTNDLCSTGTCAHQDVPDTATCEPVTRAFRQALALEGLARQLMASVGDAFSPNASGPTVTTQGDMVARLTPVTSSLAEVSRILAGKSPVPPDGGRVRGVPKTAAQLRADASIAMLKKKPAEVHAFLRLAGTAKKKRQVPRETARILRGDGRLVLERMRKLSKELRRLRRVSQTFVP
jgi:hypothetical protein